MAIGLVTDSDLFQELGRLNTSLVREHLPKVRVDPSDSIPETGTIEQMPTKGRNEGDVNIPESLRKIIGETAIIDSRQDALKLAEQFGISPSSVSAYAKGATSTASYNSPSKEIISHINQSRRRAIKRAGRALNNALGAITQEKLDYTDAKDLSVIAKNMSGIIKDLEPEKQTENTEGAQRPQFVIFAPSFRAENTFESITVNE